MYVKANKVDWLDREVTKTEVDEEINKLNLQPARKREQYGELKIKKPLQTTPKAGPYLLVDADISFKKKLDYIFRLINNSDATNDEIVQGLSLIRRDTRMAWHFLRNLDNPEWFPKIKDNVIKSIVELEEDRAVKFQLLSYFEKCADRYSDEIIPLIAKLENNTHDYNILSGLIKTLGKLTPKQPSNIKLLWKIFSKLTEHQHPWVRREIPKSLVSFTDYDTEEVLKILGKVFFYNPPPQDVTQGTPTLALTFQGRDNENWVFKGAIEALSTMMNNPKCAKKAFDLAIKVEIEAIKADSKDHAIERGVVLDYSYIWLGEKSFEKIEYNHNRRERTVLEQEKALDRFAQSNKTLTTQLLNKLLATKQEVFYLAAIKTLKKYPSNFKKISEKLVFDTKLWGIYNIRNYYLQTLITKHFEVNKKDKLKEFIKSINTYKERNKKRTLYTKQDLLVSIPKKQRTAQVNKLLKEVTDALKVKPGIVKPVMVMTSWSGPRPDITVEELQSKSNNDLLQIMVDSTQRKRAESYDIAPSFAGLISKSPSKLSGLLSAMKNKNIASDFAGQMVRAYIQKYPKKITDIAGLIPLLSKSDTFARIELARYFNGICRKVEIQKHDTKTLKTIKDSLFILACDLNPDTDETIKSSNPRPEDAITRGINSVRGIITEAIVAFGYYFPKDKEIAEKIKQLSTDKTNAIKATLIYNLRFLISKNYPLCEEVISRFNKQRDPEIDFALIHFFAKLDCQKFIDKQDFIKAIFNSTSEKTNEDLGKLIGYRYVSCCDVKELVDDIIGGRKGTKNTVRSLAFVFESQMADLIGKDKGVKVAAYLKKLLGPQNDYKVAERASFVFERNEITPAHFEFLDGNGLTSELIKNQRNVSAQSHLVNYLIKCIEADISVERCLELLHKQVTESDFLLSDHLIAKKISEIVNKLATTELDETPRKYLLDIFDAGLEKGWDEFYMIYQNYESLWN